MPVMTHRTVILCFFAVCTLVLLSVVKYIQDLPSSNSKQHKQLHDFDFHTTRQKFKRQQVKNLTRKELPGGLDLKSHGPVALNSSNSIQTLGLNVTNLTTTGEGYPGGLKVILMANMRTGSTMLGEMFNQNPNFFYLFEPLHTADLLVRRGRMRLGHLEGSITALLHKLSQCLFPREFLFDINQWNMARSKSRTIREMCLLPKCPKLKSSELKARCQKRQGNIAMKVIRANLKNVQTLLSQDHLNVKILHLIRDPRGTANSRKKFYCQRQMRNTLDESCTMKSLGMLKENPLKFKFNTVPKYCTWMHQTIKTAMSRPKWLRGNYKLIRYEDLAMEPLHFVREIYEFLGLPLHPNVAKWVRNNTHANTVWSHKIFNTRKNSSDVALSWRNSLNFTDTQAVQQICMDGMRLAGYLPISNKNDLTNLSIPVMEPLNVGHDISFT